MDTVDAHQLISELEFKGFDPRSYLDTLKEDDPGITLKIAITGAIRGTNWKKLKDTNLDFAALGYVDKLMPGKKDATVKTIIRTTSVLASQVAQILEMEKNLKKRNIESIVPACMQFPAAACIDMSDTARKAHIEYCKWFSELLPNGEFSLNIYNQMCKNPVKTEFKTEEAKSFIGLK
jgi:beta-glucosidase/6-phospho-beta-glucosidase/beta-galactosidase